MTQMLPFTKEELQQEIDLGYVNVQKHKKYDLYIYNYSQKTQFNSHWNFITMACRGLILDGDFNIVARPFQKFFNFEELNYNVPNEEWIATEKLDGSLFIVGRYKQFIITATRGSFDSDQAMMGREILQKKYIDKGVNPFKLGVTYLFEVIYKENRIVIDYNDLEDIILLATLDNETGLDIIGENPPRIGFPIVSFFQYGKSVEQLFRLKSINEKNKEGFVVKFLNSGTRIKIKFEDYIRLHRIVTGVSSKTIWECLKNESTLDEFITNVPDEFHSWVKEVSNELLTKYHEILTQALIQFELMKKNENVLITKKDKALYILNLPKHLQSVLFAMINDNSYRHIIWGQIKPKYEQPFKKEILISN